MVYYFFDQNHFNESLLDIALGQSKHESIFKYRDMIITAFIPVSDYDKYNYPNILPETMLGIGRHEEIRQFSLDYFFLWNDYEIKCLLSIKGQENIIYSFLYEDFV